MADCYYVRVVIGGEMTRDAARILLDVLQDINPCMTDPGTNKENFVGDLPDSVDWMQELADKTSGALEVFDYEGDYHEFESIQDTCISLGLPNDSYCEPTREDHGSYDAWRPGMNKVQSLGMESNGTTTISSHDIRDLLYTYIVSQAELYRVLDKVAPDCNLPMEPFRIVA